MKQDRKGTQSKCRNGPKCEFLRKGKCFFFHPAAERSENLTGKTQYLKSQNHQLGNLVHSLSFKVASLERIVNGMLTVFKNVPQVRQDLERVLDPQCW